MARNKSTNKGNRRTAADGKKKKNKRAGEQTRGFTPLPNSEIFPFAKLPPEVRNKIYSYHLASDERYNLAYFTIPHISQVSAQLRSESLSVLFAESKWFVNIGANLRDRRQDALGNEELPAGHRKRLANSGVTKMKKGIRKVLTDIVSSKDISVVFRDITFCVVEVERLDNVNKLDTKADEDARDQKAQLVIIEFSARWQNDGSAKVTIAEGENHPNNHEGRYSNDGDDFKAEDIDGPAQQAKEKVEDCVVDKEVFKGFEMSDLEKIAKQFRFCPSEKEHKLEQKAYDIFEKCLFKSRKHQCDPPKLNASVTEPGMGKRFEARKNKK